MADSSPSALPGTPRPSSRQASPAASGSRLEFSPDISPTAAPVQQTCLICSKVPVEPISLFCCQALYCNSCLADHYYETSKDPLNAKCKQCGTIIILPTRTKPLVELRRKGAAVAAGQLGNNFHPYRRPPTSGAGLGYYQPSSSGSSTLQSTSRNTVTTNSSVTQMAAKVQQSAATDKFIKDVVEFQLDTRQQSTAVNTASGSGSTEKPAPGPSVSGEVPVQTPVPSSSTSLAPSAPAGKIDPGTIQQEPKPKELDLDLIQTYWNASSTRKELAQKFLGDIDFSIKEVDPLIIEEMIKELQAKDPTKFVGVVCIICLNGSKEPVKSRCCGRMACRKCWNTVIDKKSMCPGCFQRIEEDEKKYSSIPVTLSIDGKPPSVLGAGIDHVDYKDFLGKFNDLDDYALSVIIHLLKDVREEKYGKKGHDSDKLRLMRQTAQAYASMIAKYSRENTEVRKNLSIAYQDIKYLSDRMTKKGKNSTISENFVFGQSYGTGMDFSDQMGAETADGLPVEMQETDPVVLQKVDRLRTHFDAFSHAVTSSFKMFEKYNNEDHTRASHNRMNALIDFTEGITKYKDVIKVATLNYDVESNSAMAIITGVAFDPSATRFAVAGVAKKIKVFDFNNLLEHPEGPHFPQAFLKNKSKISSIGWNPSEGNILAAADYDGHVSIWDINHTTRVVKTFQSHKKRCLALDFSKHNRNVFATGSEDNKVNLYNINSSKFASQIPCSSNVCCVQFSPFNSNYLYYGVADHNLYLVDLRQANRAVKVFRGHNKAVAYCRNINPREVVTASTDNTLRVWNIETGNCVNILKGHHNEKNFVGLDNNGDHIVCGSENTKCFFYYKGLQNPMAEDLIAKTDSPMHASEGFVSAVAWKPETDYVLAANSSGTVQLLHLS